MKRLILCVLAAASIGSCASSTDPSERAVASAVKQQAKQSLNWRDADAEKTDADLAAIEESVIKKTGRCQTNARKEYLCPFSMSYLNETNMIKSRTSVVLMKRGALGWESIAVEW